MSTVTKKPKVPIPTNFDQLMALANFVVTAVDDVGSDAAQFLSGNLATISAAALVDHNAMLSKKLASEVDTANRNAHVDDMVALLRQIRDLGFAEFSPNWIELQTYGFEVVERSGGGGDDPMPEEIPENPDPVPDPE